MEEIDKPGVARDIMSSLDVFTEEVKKIMVELGTTKAGELRASGVAERRWVVYPYTFIWGKQ